MAGYYSIKTTLLGHSRSLQLRTLLRVIDFVIFATGRTLLEILVPVIYSSRQLFGRIET